jgi:hypothetical protein
MYNSREKKILAIGGSVIKTDLEDIKKLVKIL